MTIKAFQQFLSFPIWLKVLPTVTLEAHSQRILHTKKKKRSGWLVGCLVLWVSYILNTLRTTYINVRTFTSTHSLLFHLYFDRHEVVFLRLIQFDLMNCKNREKEKKNWEKKKEGTITKKKKKNTDSVTHTAKFWFYSDACGFVLSNPK